MGGRKGHQNKQNKRPRPSDGDEVNADMPATTTTESPSTTAAPPAARPKGGEKKRQKREEYRTNLQNAGSELPQKKYYRQRAHANPFSDHALT